MTASAAAGFVFTNWTGSATTTNATLQFTMQTDLAFTAHFVDIQKPTVSIVTPTANQQWTNGTFTVKGKASDNVAVGTVYYALNGSGWAAATTANGWTNWTASLTLTPGTNTVQAYAVDTSGNFSPTNTVRFVYLVLKPLTVQIVGRGTVNSNYNGALLAINKNYKMTASAAAGFAFTNWTGSATTTNATLQFTMQTDLTFTARFVDIQKPTVNIVTPTANQQWTNGMFAMTGKASDNVAVGTVYYALNGSGWAPATTANGWTNWTASLTLTPGTNTVQAYAVDTSGNYSPTNTVRFVYLVLKPLTVQIVGRGTVNSNYNGALLAINKNYKMTASAAAGFAFTNWTGSATTTNATLQFTMQTDLAFTAHFVDIQKPTVSIVTPTANQQWTNGTFTVKGKASDNVAVGTVYYALNGSGWAAATTANGWTNWTASLTLTPGTNTVQAYAVDTSGNFSPTNTVRFVYLVLKPLTVQIVGRGTVNSNYNGALLAINKNYKMTASAAAGFAFTNWTGSATTTNATLQFTMQTDLAFTAHFVDIQKPTVSIVTPTANQQWTNGTFTVKGKASDNVAVGTVYYALNGSGWAAATTANGWTNWTASLTLTPGTNTVQAYAVDTSGNFSPTNTVRFVYLVLKPLTVQIVGRGTVNSNYNGALLAINKNYKMTASAAAGFAFTNWTGSATTTNATLQFTMQTDLAFTARFVDIQKPTVSIVTPTANQQWTNRMFAITGKAGDNVAVRTVYYALNGSGWAPATTANGWTNWTASLTLTPGTNTVQAYAVDTSGNYSPTNTVRFVYLVLKPLTVQIVGRGTVNSNYNGALLAINKNYKMTASAAAGFAFTNWTGSATTTNATLQFTMQTDLAFTAHFVDIQKPTVSIVTPTANQQWTNGTFTVKGKASDNVAVGTVYYALNGSGWAAATTANGWTNWTASLTLTPGTNTVQAYAVDTSGNYSPTNTVRFVYLVLKPLTVQIVGRGTVNSNYNGALLAINKNYKMTASAAAGFAFTNWTGSATTTNATLQFTMQTDLAFTAHFVDIQKPTVSIVTPTANQQWTNGTFTVKGKASDNVAVGTVYYALNGSGWAAATTANGWTNWTASLTLTPGTNTVQAYAVDTSGNFSPTNTVRFVYLVLKPLTVQIVGRGTVNSNYNGALLAINKNYKMTASAAAGVAFTNRTGSATTTNATLQFTMQTDLAFTAHFVDIQKPTVSIVTPASNQQWTNGMFAMTGKASDNVAVGTVYYALNGSGWAAATTANGWTNWTASLTLTPGTNTVQAYAVDTSGNASPISRRTVNFVTSPTVSRTVNFVASPTVSLTLDTTNSATPLSVPSTLGSAVYANGSYTFVVSGAPGYKYAVQVSTDLVNWVPVQTNTAPFTFVDANASHFGQRFYRSVYAP